jgi:hypothetical protein
MEEISMTKCKREESDIVQEAPMYAPIVEDARNPTVIDQYESLSNGEYLDVVFNEMKTMFNKCDFDSRKNPPVEKHGSMSIPINHVLWPVTSSKQNSDINIMSIKTQILLHIPFHEMLTQYEGSFHILNAVIRAKFVGEECYHSFYLGEHDKMHVEVYIGSIKNGDREFMQAYLVSYEAHSHGEMKEFDEFTMLTVTDGRYYKRDVKPRVINEDLALFTCYNKTRNLSCDTVASFKHGLCDTETIFTDSGEEDVPAVL